MAMQDGTETNRRAPRTKEAQGQHGKVIAQEVVFQRLSLRACYKIAALAGILLERARSDRNDEGFDNFAKVAAIRMGALSGVLMDVPNGEGEESTVEVVEGVSLAAFESEITALENAKEIEA